MIFKFLNKSADTDVFPLLFDILFENMSVIAPTGNDYEEDYKIWSENFAIALKNDARQVILIYDKETLIGYFQYSIHDETFKMEEIQFRKEHQGVGVFQKLYAFLSEIVPETVKTVEANAHKSNHKSQGILLHLGLRPVGENKTGKCFLFRGDCRGMLKKYDVRDHSIQHMTARIKDGIVMNRIQVKSSVALDTLCFLEKRLLDDTKWMNAGQIEEIKRINALLPADFGNEYLGMSSLCLIISTYHYADLEALTLDDLICDFQSPEKIGQIVRERTSNDFIASFLFPMLDWLNDGYAKEYVDKLKTLKSVGFEKIYRERVLPPIREEIARLQKEVGKINAEELFQNIAILKNVPVVDHIDIYVSFFSYPTAFALYSGSFLNCFSSSMDYYPIIAHELMHGFASDEAMRLYRKSVESDEHLKNCHDALIEDYKEGDEEEFVVAAECYLCYLSGNYSMEQLRNSIERYCGGNCPTAAVIFEMLCKEQRIPADYNDWLIRKFFKE